MDQSGAYSVHNAGRTFLIPGIDEQKARTARRERQAQELETDQQDLRDSIATSMRLTDEADAMIRRHRDDGEEPS